MRLALGFTIAAVLSAAPASAGEDLLRSDRFLGISQPFTFRDTIPPGGLPWVITSGEAKLEEDGTLKVEVVGLVFAPGTPFAGTTGPITHYAATLSCLDATGAAVNVTTGGFPTTSTGDAEIKDRVAVPPVCLAPVILIRAFSQSTGLAGPWFAMTGF